MANTEHIVTIDVSLCTGCGLCVSDCVGNNIVIKDGKATLLSPSCIKCGHCEAICPSHAAVLTGYDDEIVEFDNQTRLDPETLLSAIRTRRTVRQFTEREIDDEIIKNIIEAGRLAPTGANSQGITYAVLRKRRDECEKEAVKVFSRLLNTGKLVYSRLSNMNIDEHFFFKKAPVVIVIFANDKVSSSLAAENMAFMAEAYGLGVLYSGFFTMCVNTNAKIRKIIGVPKSPKAVTTLVLGYPKVKYRRSAHRNPANVIEA